ncbi:MAG: DNA polymerase domain-containing protein [Bacteroidota bacterium]
MAQLPAIESLDSNQILFGQNPEEQVIAIQQVGDQSVRLYKRIDGKLSSSDADFFPFFFLSDDSLLANFPKQFWMKELAGGNVYRFLAAFSRWSVMWEAVHHVLERYNQRGGIRRTAFQELEALLIKPDPLHQFLLQTGITLFKGMKFQDLTRAQLDIRTFHKSGKKSDPRRTEDRILCIVLGTPDGKDIVLDGRTLSEPELLQKFAEEIVRLDPDILEGHDLFGTLLPYLANRYELHGLECPIGRDGSNLKQISTGGEYERGLFDVAGRHCIDTLFLAESYDFSKKSLEQFGLRYLTEYFGLTPPGQESPPELPTIRDLERNPKNLIEISRQNVRDVRAISEHLSASHFHLTQMCPFPYGTIARNGSATKIESLLLREYVRQKHSVPAPEKGGQTTGGYSDLFVTGVFSRVLHADVESLYPSIMITQEISPKSDALGVWIPLLKALLDLRRQAKQQMRQSRSASAASKQDALQSAFKILLNSFYGYLGYARGLFNDYQQADAITRSGQDILRAIIKQVELFNGMPVEVDTDGILFVPPDNVEGEANEDKFVTRISETLPGGINLVLAGRYMKMLSYKKKNYALLDQKNTLTIKGSSLTSRSLERFARRFIQQCIECLLTEDILRLHHTYASFHTQIRTHAWTVADFCRTETIRDPVEAYIRDLGLGKRSMSAVYEAAIHGGLFIKAGMHVSYYVTGSDPRGKIAENCKVAEDWDANLADENTAYYLSRLDECSNKFKVFFEPKDFEKIFSMDDLFGFSPEGVTILSKKVIPDQETSPPASEEQEGLGIWLDEPGS